MPSFWYIHLWKLCQNPKCNRKLKCVCAAQSTVKITFEGLNSGVSFLCTLDNPQILKVLSGEDCWQLHLRLGYKLSIYIYYIYCMDFGALAPYSIQGAMTGGTVAPLSQAVGVLVGMKLVSATCIVLFQLEAFIAHHCRLFPFSSPLVYASSPLHILFRAIFDDVLYLDFYGITTRGFWKSRLLFNPDRAGLNG